MSETTRIAVVTGGARGAGAAICQRLAADGDSVVIVDLLADAAAHCAQEIQDKGGRAFPIPCDISKAASVQELGEQVKARFGRVDILVNNAGVLVASKCADTDEASFDRITRVNFRGTFLITRTFLPLMRPIGKTAIVNIGSTFAVDNPSNFGVYSATKAAIQSLTVTLAKEEARFGIRVNAVAPGALDTDMSHFLKTNPTMLDHVLKLTPLRRLGTPDDVARVVSFLASDEASFITGQVIAVSGGYVTPY